MAKTPKKILAVKLADIGDTITITPALRAIKASYPKARLDVLVSNGRVAVEGLPYVDRVLVFDKYSYDRAGEAFKPANLGRAVRFFGRLALARYDLVIFFHHYSLAFGALKFAALALASLAPVRVGLEHGRRSWFLNRKVADRGFGAVSETNYWLELAKAIGASLSEGDDGRPDCYVSAADRIFADELLAEFEGQKLLALGPGSGGYSLSRRWFPLSYAQVADELLGESLDRVLILGTPDEQELAEEIKGLMRWSEKASILAGKTSVGQAVAVLEKCSLFIGNDGGLTHLAAVAGTPSTVIFGPTNAPAWKPFGEKVEVVQAPLNLPCRPCLYRELKLGSRFGCAPRPCLTAIQPSQVRAAALRVLDQSLESETLFQPGVS